MDIKKLTQTEFDSFINENNYNSIYQTSAYANTMKNQGYTPLLLGFLEDEKIIGVSLILIENRGKFKYAYAPRGFLINYKDSYIVKMCTNMVKKYLSKLDVIAIKISPLIIKNIYNSKKELLVHDEDFNNIYINLKSLGYYHLGYNNYFEANKPRFEAILNLERPYYETFYNIKKSFRTKIRNAEKCGIKVYRGDINNIQDLYIHTKRKYPKNEFFFADMFNNFAKNNNAALYYTKVDTKDYLIYCQKLYEKQEAYNLNLDNSILINDKNNEKLINKKIIADNLLERYKKQLVNATSMLKDNPNGIITSSTLIIINKDTVYLYMDGYDKKYQSLNSKHLLLWKLIEKYSLQGYKNFNLGGVISIFSSNEKYNGLNDFKLSFSPNIVEYVGDLELICNNTLYFMYKNSLTLKNTLPKFK